MDPRPYGAIIWFHLSPLGEMMTSLLGIKFDVIRFAEQATTESPRRPYVHMTEYTARWGVYLSVSLCIQTGFINIERKVRR